jgi:hypothetical protein
VTITGPVRPSGRATGRAEPRACAPAALDRPRLSSFPRLFTAAVATDRDKPGKECSVSVKSGARGNTGQARTPLIMRVAAVGQQQVHDRGGEEGGDEPGRARLVDLDFSACRAGVWIGAGERLDRLADQRRSAAQVAHKPVVAVTG